MTQVGVNFANDQDDADENVDGDDVDDDDGGPDTCIMHIAHQAELLKLHHFRRFLHSSGLSQLDFLLRVGTIFLYLQKQQQMALDAMVVMRTETMMMMLKS